MSSNPTYRVIIHPTTAIFVVHYPRSPLLQMTDNPTYVLLAYNQGPKAQSKTKYFVNSPTHLTLTSSSLNLKTVINQTVIAQHVVVLMYQ